ncbi:MAG: YkgJ family cysteine cluster protein [Actinobacteria bacterium]|nr:YkgJ family cysteine cluster protein [Actinomycetota bacterium]
MSTANGQRTPLPSLPHVESPSLPHVDWARPHDDTVTQLERQLVRGSHFAQAALDKLVARLARMEAAVAALHELLLAAGLIAEEETEPTESVADSSTAEDASSLADPSLAPEDDGDMSPMVSANWPGIAFGTEPMESEEPAPVDCAARMHICHAVCCKLNFALTPPEVESGTTKWDLGFPYMIRHESNGYCTHNDTVTGRCGIYADRPGVCRRYSCANDTRIWKDFENMELNEEYIRENLQNRSRILVRPTLPIMEINSTPTPG